MANLNRFAHEMAHLLQSSASLEWCTRVDMVADQESDMVAIFPRTEEYLTERMLGIPPFQYPVSLLVNTTVLITQTFVCTDVQEILLAADELTTAALSGVGLGDNHGARIEDDILYVPLINAGESTSAWTRAWSAIAEDPAHVSPDTSSGAITLYITHLPDFQLDNLSGEQLLQLTRLAVGWNHCGGLSESELWESAKRLTQAARVAQTIVNYR